MRLTSINRLNKHVFRYNKRIKSNPIALNNINKSPITLKRQGSETFSGPELNLIERNDTAFNVFTQMSLIDKQFMQIYDRASENFSIAETAQKYISLRSTLFPRLFGEIDSNFSNEIHDKINNWEGTSGELLQYFKERLTYNSLTVHPTEGRTLDNIKNTFYLTEYAMLMAKVNGLNPNRAPTVLDAMKLKFFCMKSGIKESFNIRDMENDFDNFNYFYTKLINKAMDRMIAKPLGHYQKMTKEQEILYLLFWGGVYRLFKAEISNRILNMNRQINLEKMGFLNDTTWAGDRDGKEEIDAFHYCQFEFTSQQKFFETLSENLEILILTYHEYNKNALSLENAKELIHKISTYAEENKVVYNITQAKEYENQLIKLIREISFVIDDEFETYIETLMSFIRNSNLRIFENGFTSREETSKIHLTIKNLVSLYTNRDNVVGEEYDNTVDELLENTEEFMEQLMEKDSSLLLDENSQKQLACHIASLRFHQNHEHIISNFDSKVLTFKEHILLDKLARLISQNHTAFPFLRKFYERGEGENKISFYQTIFKDEESVASIPKAKNFISTLAEDEEAMVSLIGFYKEALEVPVIRKYLENLGEIRLTISKSDGSESTGNYKECFISTTNAIEIEEIAKRYGLKCNILLGVGGNDPERGAYSESKSIRPRQTLQGMDIGNNVNVSRIKNSLLRPDPDLNKKLLKEFLEKPINATFMKEITSTMCDRHLKSYYGIYTKYKGTMIHSGRTLFRGPIVMDVQKILGRASARGDTRKEEISKEEFIQNIPTNFKNLDKKLRRIGEVNTNRISGVVPFLMENYFESVTDRFDNKLLKEMHTIPMFRDIAFNALMAIASSDTEIFLLNNGFTGEYKLEDQIIKSYSELFNEIYTNYNQSNNEFDIVFLKKLHISHVLVKLKQSLRHVADLLLIDAEPETIRIVHSICDKLEKSPSDQSEKLFKNVIHLCAIASEDKRIDDNLRDRFKVTTGDIYYKSVDLSLRRNFVYKANQALKENQIEEYNKAVGQLAQLIRGSGNPFGKGSRHDDDLLKYYQVRKNLEDRSRTLLSRFQ